MEDSRQDLRTEFRAATESSGLACLPRSAWRRQAGFGLASAADEGWRMEDGGMKTPEGGHKNEERGTGRASGAFAIRV